MILLIIVLLIDSYILNKYEKGHEHFYSFLFALILMILYYYDPLLFFTKPLRIFFELTLSIFLFFQIYSPLLNNKKEKDVLVVLGCGLMDKNRISPLLMKRCNIAVDLYNELPRKIVVSGGKGNDEEISEAIVMKHYLIEKGIDENDIICEDKSKSTKENLINTKKIIGSSFMIITSDYHAVRSFIISKFLGLNISIYTSETIYYYKFYAIAREYIATLFLFKEWMILLYFLIVYFNHYFLCKF